MDTYLRIGEVAKILGVSVDTLRRWENDGRVAFERQGNRRVLRADQLSTLLDARRSGNGHSSARNRLTGTVVSLETDSIMAKVEMSCGDFRIVSLVSRESVEDLGLRVGSPAVAVIKATNVVIETA